MKVFRSFRLRRRCEPLCWHGAWHVLFHSLRFAPGVVGLWARAWLLRRIAKRVGERVEVEMDSGIVPETTNHEWRDGATLLDRRPVRPLPVFVEGDVWTGNRVVIDPGVQIGRGSVIDGGAVVTCIVPPDSVVAAGGTRITRRLGDPLEGSD